MTNNQQSHYNDGYRNSDGYSFFLVDFITGELLEKFFTKKGFYDCLLSGNYTTFGEELGNFQGGFTARVMKLDKGN